MYFASSAGRGFIISDDEEITGVISGRNKKNKTRSSSFRDKISDTINDTLRRKKKLRSKLRPEQIEFLFVNKPNFSSDESLHVLEPEKSKFKTEISHFVNGPPDSETHLLY